MDFNVCWIYLYLKILLMKIVFLTEDIFGESVGGVEFHIYNISKELAKIKNEIFIISLLIGKKSDYSKKLIFTSKNNSKVWLIKITKKSFFFHSLEFLNKRISGVVGMIIGLISKIIPNFFYKSLINEVNKLKPDLVHQHDYLANIVASKKLSKIYPIIFTNHTGQYLYLEKFFLGRVLQKYLIKHYKYIIGPSNELTPKRPNAIYISNGVDVNFFNGKKIKKEIEKTIFICPRRWAPTKGIIYLADAILKLDDNTRSKSLFLFAGSESNDYLWYKDQVLKKLNKLPENTFKLLGNLDQEELKKNYLSSDVVLIPSLMEATSLAAMEAMSCGLPVLSTNVGGMPEIITNGKTGWLVEKENSTQLASLIKNIINNEFNILKLGENAKKFVHENKSWEKIAKETNKIYNKFI